MRVATPSGARAPRMPSTTSRSTSLLTAQVIRSVIGRSGGLARANSRAVGTDLGPVAAHLRRVEAHCDDGVGALGLCFFDHPVDHLLPAVDECLRHSLELAADDRLQAGAALRAAVPRSNGDDEAP